MICVALYAWSTLKISSSRKDETLENVLA